MHRSTHPNVHLHGAPQIKDDALIGGAATTEGIGVSKETFSTGKRFSAQTTNPSRKVRP